MPPLVEMENITKHYPMGAVGVAALQEVSLSIQPGEIVAVMGPSGSGKSTLLHIMGCLDQPTSGSYRLEGVEVGGMGEDRLAAIRNRHIGFVFQTFNLLPRASALSNVELPLIYGGGGGRRERALSALGRVGLSHRASHRPTQLSGGEQQRVAIARALVNNPSLILADEPTGNLDSASSQEIMALFQELNQEKGITMVIVTHEREVADYAHRILFFRDGRIVAQEVKGEGV